MEPLEPVLVLLPDEVLAAALLLELLLDELAVELAVELALELACVPLDVPEVPAALALDALLLDALEALELERDPDDAPDDDDAAAVEAAADAADEEDVFESGVTDPAQASEDKHTAARIEDERRFMARAL